jgi:uncharacterized membrane protein YdjX (TVP38/TMEM64 family)
MSSLERVRNLNRKNLLQIAVFILIFGVAVGLLSGFLSNVIDPANNRYIQEVLQHQTLALVLYFVFVMFASVIVPIPTLPFDLLLFGILDPATVVIIRVFGGIAGGSISYYLSYNYGRPLLKRLLSSKNYEIVESLSNSFAWREFFIITMIPVINAELMAYVGGLGKLGYRKTVFTLFLGIAYRVIFVAAITILK